MKNNRKCGPGCRCCNYEKLQVVAQAAISPELSVEDVQDEEVSEDNAVRQEYLNEMVEVDFSDDESSPDDLDHGYEENYTDDYDDCDGFIL